MWSKLKVDKRRWLAVLITTPTVAGLVIIIKMAGLFQLLEWATYDQFFRIRPAEPIDERLLIVTVDESDINYVKKWPLPDQTLAQLIKTLQLNKAGVIGLDFYRDLPVQPGHQDWQKVMKSTPNLIGVEKALGMKVGPPQTLSKLKQVALTDLLVDADGKVRRALLSHYTSDRKLRFGLGSKIALMYLEERGLTLKTLDRTKKHYRLGKGVFVPFSGDEGAYVRTNSAGYQIFLNYRGAQDRFRTVSLTKMLKNQVDPSLIRDRIILIGSTAPSLNDLLYTPYSSQITSSPQAVPGVIVHANIASQILSAALDGRPLIRAWSSPIEWAWILVWSGIGATIHWGILEISLGKKQIATRCFIRFIYLFSIGSILIVGSYFAFLAGWWIPVIPPLVALTGSASATALYQMLKLQQQRSELTSQTISLEKEKIKAEAASQAKSEFLAKMSHELRTPLNAILGFSQIISRSSELNTEHREYINIINRSGEHLLELINDILDLSKIEAGMMSLEESSFDLYSLIDNLEEISKLKASSKNLDLIVDINSDVPQHIKTDKKKLRICLLNLLSNALKFTQVGKVILRVALLQPPESERHKTDSFQLLFEVEDTGQGIANEEIEHLFKDFVQTQTGRNATEGTGLGLSITNNFVQLLGGQIIVDSIFGEGTSFKFNIKFKAAETLETTTKPQQQVVALEPEQPVYRILVVDDLKENRILLVKLLETIGFDVRQATNGKEAVALCDWQPHLIWMNTRMPIMDGLEAAREIRAKEKEKLQYLPEPLFRSVIISLSANTLEDRRSEILAAGCDDLVIKPFTDQVIFQKMADYLGVRYIYKDIAEIPTSSRLLDTIDKLPNDLFKQELATMPISWLTELHQAALVLDEELVIKLIEQIPDQNSLAEILKELLNNFRFDLILEFTQEIINDSSISKC